MPWLEIAFLVCTLFAVAARLRHPRTFSRSADALVIVALVAGLAQLAVQGPRILLSPAYAVLLLLTALAVVRRGTARFPEDRVLSKARTTLRVAGTITALLLVAVAGTLERILFPLVNAPSDFLSASTDADFSTLGWESAFRSAVKHLSRDYAFTVWKAIKWDSLERVYAPRIADAERRRDRAAYYSAVRAFVWSIPDGHVGVEGPDMGLRDAAIGAGFGLGVITLDDARTVAHVVMPNGPAASGGMRWGAELVSWNGARVADTLQRVPLLWADSPPATEEGARLARLKLLPRAPAGTRVSVTFRNPGETATTSAQLVAEPDKYEALRAAWPRDSIESYGRPVTWRILPEGFGYLRILVEVPLLGGLLPDLVVRRAAAEFVKERVPGVIIDVRGNRGGADKLVAEMMGHFVDRPIFYERAAYFDSTARRFVPMGRSTLRIVPKKTRYTGPLVALIDNDCVSSCEGVAWAVRARGGQVVGRFGTYGSFGMSGGKVRLPGRLTIEYPNGQSVDSLGAVQLDSDARMRGGVSPDVRVPLDLETVRREWVDGDDVVLEHGIAALRRKPQRAVGDTTIGNARGK